MALTVHAFDPTPFAEEWVATQSLPQEFVFHPWAAAGEDGSLRLYRRLSKRGRASKVMWTAESGAGDAEDFIDAPAYTTRTIMDKLGHEDVDLLKIDVEGAEYDILESLQDVALRCRSNCLLNITTAFQESASSAQRKVLPRYRGWATRSSGFPSTGREICFVHGRAM